MPHLDQLLLPIFLGFFLMLIFASVARPHGEAAWIMDGGYKNKSGESCCGPSDCRVIDPDFVKTDSRFYYVRDVLHEASYITAVSRSEVLTSKDGQFWRCGTYEAGVPRVKCLFAPPESL